MLRHAERQPIRQLTDHFIHLNELNVAILS